ncbi:MAG: hypothetical protein OCU20_02270 [Methanophagales archaeon]|nr:hypothetical protein [Methanophagales archaeon]
MSKDILTGVVLIFLKSSGKERKNKTEQGAKSKYDVYNTISTRLERVYIAIV